MAFVHLNVPKNTPIQSITRKRTCTLDGNAHMEKAATRREIDKPGQLLAQGFKLACSVDRVGVQARATAFSTVQC